ncbi:unnamed protein product [Xylocopa violacea]|uniref:Hymenoptaecin n=1 Tax=Xylocopa violacea TaxID=135666 RepID=A0ABP1NIY1_XYLVO
MRIYLCLAIVVVCEAIRIPRVTEQLHFPNFQTAYQDHNYPNHYGAPFLRGYRPQEGNIGLERQYYGRHASTVGQDHFVNHLAGAPFRGGEDTGPHGYERFNHAFNYDYQL